MSFLGGSWFPGKFLKQFLCTISAGRIGCAVSMYKGPATSGCFINDFANEQCSKPGCGDNGNLSCDPGPIIQINVDDPICMRTVTSAPGKTKTIQGFINDKGGQIFDWTSGSSYWTIDYGCGPNPTGTYVWYSITTYEDGTQAKTNEITLEIS